MRLLVLLALAMLSSGCLASSATVSELVVLVTDAPGGPPVAGARVSGRSGDWLFGYSDEAVTDAQGQARLRLPSDTTLTVEKLGFVTESRVSASGTSGPFVFPLYRERLNITLEGQLEDAALSTHGTPVPARWDPQLVSFGASPEARQGYARRILTLDATLSWTNSLSGGGDLALGLGRGAREADVWHDSDAHQMTVGPHQERLRLNRGDFEEAGWEGAAELYAGAGPGKGYATASSIPYTITLEARFGQPYTSPGAPMGAIVALVVAALLVRRSRA